MDREGTRRLGREQTGTDEVQVHDVPPASLCACSSTTALLFEIKFGSPRRGSHGVDGFYIRTFQGSINTLLRGLMDYRPLPNAREKKNLTRTS